MARMLDVGEIRLLAEAHVDELQVFARSPRLHAADAKGETPLHIAARCGKLALCDLFIRHGADPGVRNFNSQTPAEVAAAEGHAALSQLLMALELDDGAADSSPPRQSTNSEHSVAPMVEVVDTLWFEAEEEAEAFQNRIGARNPVVEGPSPAPTYPITVNDGATEWDLDPTLAPLAGEGIAEGLIAPEDSRQDGDFLVIRSKGRRSSKPAVLPVGTRMQIDPDYCRSWTSETIQVHRLPMSDVQALISSCSGNADTEDLWNAVDRILDIAGIEHQDGDDPALWDSPVTVNEDDLGEALEATLTRDTRLPGMGRFLMDRSEEEMLISPMLQIKSSLHVALLGSDDAIRVILRFVNMVLAGELQPARLTLLSVSPDRENDPGSNVLREVSDTLKAIIDDGIPIEGKRRRIAVHALDRLDLSAVFFKDLGRYLEERPGQHETARAIGDLISELEVTTERLILAHLPYVRRFASRNVDDSCHWWRADSPTV